MWLWPDFTQQARTNPTLRYVLCAVSTCISDHKTISHSTNSHTLPDRCHASSSTQVLSHKSFTSAAARALSGHPASPMAYRLQPWLTASTWFLRKRSKPTDLELHPTSLALLPSSSERFCSYPQPHISLAYHYPFTHFPISSLWAPNYTTVFLLKKKNKLLLLGKGLSALCKRELIDLYLTSKLKTASSSQNLRIRCNPKILCIFSLSFTSLLITIQNPARIYFFSWSHPAEILIHIWCFRMSFNFQDFSYDSKYQRAHLWWKC